MSARELGPRYWHETKYLLEGLLSRPGRRSGLSIYVYVGGSVD